MAVINGELHDMYPAKAPYITQTIERRVRRGIYTTQIPSTRHLCEEFGVARQTMTDALKVLVQSGTLVSCRRNGLVIDRRNLKHGTILLISDAPLNHTEALEKAVGQDRLRFQTASARNQQEFDRVFPEDGLGAIFVNSSLTVELAESCARRQIPFVSCNQMPGYRHINWVDFDNYQALKELFRKLTDAGYRRIGALFSGRMENYNDMFRRNLLRLKRELQLPHESYDDIVVFWQTSPMNIIKKSLDYYQRKQNYPDVLCCFMSPSAEQIEEMLRLPHKMLLVVEQNTPTGPVHDRLVTFINTTSVQELYLQGYELLREVIFTPGKFPEQRLLTPRHKFSAPIPPKSEISTE